ncbi:hypothetical protein KUTeg_000059, partial [Tegillarca granosa]
MSPSEDNRSSEVPSLHDLNTRYASYNLGGIVFVATLMGFGVIGNAHVLYIYATKFKPSNHRLYILCMASLDMATCCIGMPFILVDLNYPLMFESVVICKSLRFLNYFMVMVFVKPFEKQMTTKRAKYACALGLIISVSLSWPAPILYGHSTVDAQTISAMFRIDYNITGTQCFTEDKYKNTKYQAYYNIILLVVIIASTIILCTLYSLIVRTIFKNSEYFDNECRKDLGHSTETVVEFPPSSSVRLTTFKKYQLTDIHERTLNQEEELSQNNNDKRDKKCIKNWRTDQSKKITVILAIVTVVFILSYIPHLSLKTKAMLTPQFFLHLSDMELFLYNTFVWTFFISNMSNPIIYGLCVSKFRHH